MLCLPFQYVLATNSHSVLKAGPPSSILISRLDGNAGGKPLGQASMRFRLGRSMIYSKVGYGECSNRGVGTSGTTVVHTVGAEIGTFWITDLLRPMLEMNFAGNMSFSYPFHWLWSSILNIQISLSSQFDSHVSNLRVFPVCCSCVTTSSLLVHADVHRIIS